jgi:hypothetical protein
MLGSMPPAQRISNPQRLLKALNLQHNRIPPASSSPQHTTRRNINRKMEITNLYHRLRRWPVLDSAAMSLQDILEPR